jgi:Stigma-specific protein, Stig1
MPKEDQSSTRSHQGFPQGGVELSLDELAKGLATGTLSRGKAIRWMGGALLGTALASFPGVAWANDCRRLGRECRRDSQCCSKNCVRRGDDKVCGCPEGKRRCGDRCVNLKTNENHCGECFNRCEEGQECVEGICSGGEPICNPPCLSDTCVCRAERPDGTGAVCVDCGRSGCQQVSSCADCPPDRPVCFFDEFDQTFTCGSECCIGGCDPCTEDSQCCSGLICHPESRQCVEPGSSGCV